MHVETGSMDAESPICLAKMQFLADEKVGIE
jgi:hypothetical protein